MSPSRQILPLLLCMAYLPSAMLPCPTAGLDRSRVPRAEAGSPHAAAPPATPAGEHGAHQHGAHAAAPAASSKRFGDPVRRFQAPCPCGCDQRANGYAGGGRLGPVLASASSARIALPAAALHAAPRAPLPDPPFHDLDPIPI